MTYFLRKITISMSIFFGSVALTTTIFAWGEEGHKMTAEVARKYLDPEVLKEVETLLNGTSLADAAVWMDEVRRESRYFHMVTWHYINLEKDEEYKKNNEENIVNELRIVVKKLNNRKKYSKKDIERHLKILFHLMGDLHQPMHNGYGSDRGGNNVPVQIRDNPTNLHGVWDYEIISLKKITTADCLKWGEQVSPEELKAIGRLNVVDWFKESRAYLDVAYATKDGKLDDQYIDTAAEIVKSRIFKGGYRLASVLNRLFKKGEEKKPEAE